MGLYAHAHIEIARVRAVLARLAHSFYLDELPVFDAWQDFNLNFALGFGPAGAFAHSAGLLGNLACAMAFLTSLYLREAAKERAALFADLSLAVARGTLFERAAWLRAFPLALCALNERAEPDRL